MCQVGDDHHVCFLNIMESYCTGDLPDVQSDHPTHMAWQETNRYEIARRYVTSGLMSSIEKRARNSNLEI